MAETWKKTGTKESRSKKTAQQKKGCGCSLLVPAIFLLLIFLSSAFEYISQSGSGEPPPLLMLVVIAILFFAAMRYILPDRKARKEERERQHQRENADFDPNSPWDMQIKAFFDKRQRKTRGLRMAAKITLVGVLALAAAVAILMELVLPVVNDEYAQAFTPGYGLFAGVVVLFLLGGVPLLLYMASFLTNTKKNFLPANREEYRQRFVFPRIHAAFQQPVFYPPEQLDTSMIDKSRILGPTNEITCNDFLHAVYRDVPFYSADISATGWVEVTNTDSDGYTSTDFVSRKVFWGRWIFLASVKDLPNGFSLWSKNFMRRAPKLAVSKGLSPVVLDNALFNRHFEVYAPHPQDAFRFLTPAVMECLERLMVTENGDPAEHAVAMVCTGNSVQVCLSGIPDAFEPGRFVGELTEAASVARVNRDIAVLTDVIDSLYGNLR